MSNNPLMKHYRTVKLTVQLPSKGIYYDDSIIEKNQLNEYDVYPMTAKHEIDIKTPDSLYSGNAASEMIKSCIPAIREPRSLTINDLNAVMLAIRCASFGKTLDATDTCQHCKKENTVAVNIKDMLSNIEYMEPPYTVNTDTGLTLFLTPSTMKSALKQFKEELLKEKSIENIIETNANSKDESAMEQQVSKIIKNYIAETQKTLAQSIIKAVDESSGIEVTTQSDILEYLTNVDRDTYHKINEEVDKINRIGCNTSFTIKCGNEACGKEYTSFIDFDPSSFFSKP